MAPVAVPSANATAAELHLAKCGHLGSGQETPAKPKASHEPQALRAGGASVSPCPLCASCVSETPLSRGEEGLSGGQPPGQAALWSLLPVCGCTSAVRQGPRCPPRGLQLVRRVISGSFSPFPVGWLEARVRVRPRCLWRSSVSCGGGLRKGKAAPGTWGCGEGRAFLHPLSGRSWGISARGAEEASGR